MQARKTNVIAASVKKLLRAQANQHVANLLMRLHPADVPDILVELGDRDKIAVFSILMKRDRERAAEALKAMGPDQGTEMLLKLPREEASRLLQELEGDDAAVFVSELPEEVGEELLERMRVESSTVVQGLLRYEKETAGRIMTPHVFEF